MKNINKKQLVGWLGPVNSSLASSFPTWLLIYPPSFLPPSLLTTPTFPKQSSIKSTLQSSLLTKDGNEEA